MNIAFIPVRGGSKSIPLKNIKLINGKPLVYWSIKAACQCHYIDRVYVATDSTAIKSVIAEIINTPFDETIEKLSVIGRSNVSASDNAPTELALLEFAENNSFDNVALIQATSPLLTSSDLDGGFELFSPPDVDSVLSGVRQKRFIWSVNSEGYVQADNYNIFDRPRRQEFNGYLVENGAFYITSRANLHKSQNRISGNIKMYEMSENSYFEIDEPSDWVIIEQFMKETTEETVLGNQSVKMFLTDCDGCLTDAGMYYTESGDEIKKFSALDGMAFERLRNAGIITGIITSENVELVARRAKKLKIDILKMGAKNKAEIIKKLCQDYNLDLSEIVYIGDDLNDLEAISLVGYGCCVKNAIKQVKTAAKYITTKSGGNGAIREIVDLLFEQNLIPQQGDL